MMVYIVGNQLVERDSVPFQLLRKLQSVFAKTKFVEVDPTENFIPEDDSIIIDTIAGIDTVTWFDSLDLFVDSPKISPHDYDLLLHLQLLKKLRRINRVSILGIPQKFSSRKALPEVRKALHTIISN